MSLTEFASIADVVSGAAVVISFVFLAVQIRQNTQNQRATIHHDRISHINDFIQTVTTSRRAMEENIRCRNGDEAMDAIAYNQYAWFQYSHFSFYQEYFLMRQEGMLSDERFAHSMNVFKVFIAEPGMRATFRFYQDMFAPSFRTYVEDLMKEIPLTEGAADWSVPVKALLDAERAAAKQAA